MKQTPDIQQETSTLGERFEPGSKKVGYDGLAIGLLLTVSIVSEPCVEGGKGGV